MIDAQFIYFTNDETYQQKKNEIAEHSIAFVQDSAKIITHGVEYQYVSWNNIMDSTEYVDLRLPSKLLWAKYNLGAKSEEESGLYFQWGDTQGYTAEQVGDGEGLKAFTWEDYKFSIDGSSSNFSKYNTTDNKTVLDLEDDAAYVSLGGDWRMPTYEEFKELCLNTDIFLITAEGKEIQGTAREQSGSIMINWASQAEGTLKGVKFYKKGDKQIYMFVPASGVAIVGSMQDVGQGGGLWSSSLISSDVQGAWDFYFDAGNGYVISGNRYVGLPVRPVKQPQGN